MREIWVEDWEHLQSVLFEDSQDKHQRQGSPYVFRGQSDVNYDLRTSLMRLVDKKTSEKPTKQEYKDIESLLLRDFSKYAYRDVPNQSVWHLLSVAQHHELPTRLLDWTFSPLVASHFATENVEKFDTNGVIWRINYKMAHRKLPDEFSSVFDGERPSVFTVDMLEGTVSSILEEKRRIEEEKQNIHGVRDYNPTKSTEQKIKERLEIDTESISYQSISDSLDEFDQINDKEFVIFFEPPSLDERIANQSALFSIMPDPNARLDEWIEEYPELGERIVIPSRLKPQIRDYLDQANITERVLFPGLDGLANWLKRYHTPKPKQKTEKILNDD